MSLAAVGSGLSALDVTQRADAQSLSESTLGQTAFLYISCLGGIAALLSYLLRHSALIGRRHIIAFESTYKCF